MNVRGKLSAFLAVAMVFTLCACNTKTKSTSAVSEENGTYDGSLPIVKTPIHLKFAVKQRSYTGDWNNLPVPKELEKRTNIQITYQMVPEQSSTEKFNIMLASGDLPDAFIAADFNMAQTVVSGDQGTFLKINNYIDKDMPNFKKVMKQFPEVSKGISSAEGNIYSLPKVNVDSTSKAGDMLWLNENWMKKLNEKMPTTVDDLYKILKDFKTKDPNGNGKQDEIPLSNKSKGVNDSIIQYFAGCFGIQDRGPNSRYVDVDPKTNKLRFIPTSDSYKELLEFLKKLYDEQLLDPEVWTMDVNKLFSKSSQGVLGSYLQPNTQYSTADNPFVPVTTVLKGPHGDQLNTTAPATIDTPNCFIITNKNKYPEETLRWVDYFYGDEGAKLELMGVEGQTYTVKNGDYYYNDSITNAKEGFTTALSKYTTWVGIPYPGIKTVKYGGHYNTYADVAVSARNSLAKYVPKEIWNTFVFSTSESKIINSTGNDIQTYVLSMQAQFITGKASLTNDWSKYVSQIKSMGLDDYMNVYQSADNRYEKK